MQLTVAGRDVFVHTGGALPEGADRVVLLVHGAGNDHTIWRFVTRRLASAGYPVLAPDLPGHGRSGGTALESVGEMADWCVGLLDVAGAGDTVVIGHSMGSLIAMEMAVRDPRRVRAVGLIATAERMAVHPELQQAADDEDRLAADLIVGWSHTGRSRFGHHTAPGLWMTGANRRLLEQNAGSLGTDLAACAAWDGSRIVPDIGVPALVIAGEQDRMAPARGGRAVAEGIAGAELVEVAGGSHASVYDHPESVVEPLIAWLRRIWASQ